MAVSLEVPREVILDRLTTRRTCENPKCQAIYNVKSSPTKVEGICDKCGSKVIQREDETEEAISHRLETYNEKTAPLTGYYEKEGLLMTVNATSSDAVVSAIQERMKA
jgi:adenylate kinase